MDSGYVKNGEFISYTEEEIALFRRKYELENNLKNSLIDVADVFDSFFDAVADTKPGILTGVISFIANIVDWKIKTRKEYAILLKQRNEWRKELNEINKRLPME